MLRPQRIKTPMPIESRLQSSPNRLLLFKDYIFLSMFEEVPIFWKTWEFAWSLFRVSFEFYKKEVSAVVKTLIVYYNISEPKLFESL